MNGMDMNEVRERIMLEFANNINECTVRPFQAETPERRMTISFVSHRRWENIRMHRAE